MRASTDSAHGPRCAKRPYAANQSAPRAPTPARWTARATHDEEREQRGDGPAEGELLAVGEPGQVLQRAIVAGDVAEELHGDRGEGQQHGKQHGHEAQQRGHDHSNGHIDLAEGGEDLQRAQHARQAQRQRQQRQRGGGRRAQRGPAVGGAKRGERDDGQRGGH